MKKTLRIPLFLAAMLGLTVAARAQLPTGMTVVPFYDTSKAGLSFAKDRQSVVGMWEIPGKPEHFLVLGYWGYIWSLYPDTTKAYAAGAIKDYTKKQVADFNNVVMKGWEQGALGGAFDPDFAFNRYFYIIYNKYANVSSYHGGIKPTSADGPGAEGLVVVERWKVSADYKALTRDTTIFAANHSTGYGSSNMVFGKDKLLYITADAYSQNSWDSTIFMRKVLRIDVSKPQGGRMYTIPDTNPFYNAANPAVKKEIFAFGFRNTYSITADYLTGSIWGAEVGQGTWEEVNIIKAGKNYGWGNGGDGAAVGSNSIGIEGPCNPTGGGYTGIGTDTANMSGATLMNPYSRTYKGRTYTCSDFTNGTWNFNHSGADTHGSKTALPGVGISCIILSQAFRGDPASPFYGYHFVTDVASNYFIAVKEGVALPVKVGGVPNSLVFDGDKQHNGITSFSEDAFGNMYITMLSSSSNGAFAWHDIYRMSHPQMKPLPAARESVFPTRIPIARNGAARPALFNGLIVNANQAGGTLVRIPQGYSGVEVYSLGGKLLWTATSGKTGSAATLEGSAVRLPAGLEKGALGTRFLP
ncbi:MAG: Glucose/sorbosone dehydrogenase [Fibrobacteres bacterium]|nr:Glucose/sorbosone dehydrogenase [Fibrobacterota bacterium]